MLGPKATKNCLENLATNENGNWSSFQLANRAPPLSVTGSPIAPSARMIAIVKWWVSTSGFLRNAGCHPFSQCGISDALGASLHPVRSVFDFVVVSGVSRAKIEEVTLNALRTRQSLVKGERLVRHEVRAVLPIWGDNLIYVCSRISLAGLLLPVRER